MNAEQLQDAENAGRRLATVLLDAGYSKEFVCSQVPCRGTASQARSEARHWAQLGRQDYALHRLALAWARKAGALTVLEEREAAQ